MFSPLVTTVLVMFCACSAAMAADHTVTNNADTGDGTLRTIIAGASSGESIDFDAGLDTIVLTSGEIAITQTLTIIGPTYDLAVSGNGSSRIFDIDGSGITVLISDLIITNGLATGSAPATYGGGIYIGNDPGQSVTISNCTIVECTADAYGGGLFQDDGTLTLVGCTIVSNNATDDGGGLYLTRDSTAVCTIRGCTISGNSTDYSGGGIAMDDGDVLIENNTVIADNEALASNRDGGGLYVSAGATLTVRDSRISGNKAQDKGGGVYLMTGDYTLDTCRIYGNQSGDGGGIAIADLNDPAATGTIASCVLSNNTAGSGGGIYSIGDTNNLSLAGCTITANRASSSGGGMYLYTDIAVPSSSHLLITDTTFSNNAATNNGGGILANDYLVWMTNCTFSDNTAATLDGGGTYLGGGQASLEMDGCTVSGCWAADDGGGIWVSDPVVIRNSTFSANDASGAAGRGGAIYFSADGDTLRIYNSTIYTNTCGEADYGGGIYRGGGDVYLYSTIIAGNNNRDLRGTIHTLTNCCYQTEQSIGTPAGGDNVVDDPKLGPLADNEGPTMTHALQAGSPCIHQGINVLGLLTDQRGSGYARVTGAGCDIGAFELGSGPRAGTFIFIR